MDVKLYFMSKDTTDKKQEDQETKDQGTKESRDFSSVQATEDTQEEELTKSPEGKESDEGCDCEDCNCNNKEDEYKEKYMRALADYHNLSRRVEREREETYQFISLSILTKILPVLDDLERAAGTIDEPGIDLIYNKLWQVVKDEGLEKIKIGEDDQFDPTRMECITAEDGGKKLITVRSGYIMKGKVVRPAQVKVVK